jgi:hypothetical protein
MERVKLISLKLLENADSSRKTLPACVKDSITANQQQHH